MNNKNKSRTYNSIINSIVGIIASVITILLNFIVRIVIVKQLGEEINGIHNLFQSITNMIALIEAGFSTAMIIHLYKPIKEQDKDKTYAIIHFYKKIYIIISVLYFFIGLFIDLFFINDVVKSSLSKIEIQIYFLIYILITPANYLTYYKVSILYAEQKNRIRFIANSISELIFRILQIISMFILKNYYIFLVLLIFEKIFCNYLCIKYVNKDYSFLNKKNGVNLSKIERKKIYKTVKPIFICNIASNIQSSVKSILISILNNNVKFVGYFGNYQLVAGTAQLLFSQFGCAITSSFGNLAVEKDTEHMYDVYKKITFVLDWIAILLCSGFLCCIQSFIFMVFGENFLLSTNVIIIIVLDLFVNLYNVPIISVQGAMGLHRSDQNAMIIQAIISSFLGYILGIKYGMFGILLGMFIPQFIFTYIYKGIVINKKAFNRKWNIFIYNSFCEIIKGLFVIAVSYIICHYIEFDSMLLNFIFNGFIAVLITLLCFIAFSWKNKNFIYFINLFKTKIRRKKI